MNIYFYLSTQSLVRVIQVCKQSQYSVEARYNRLPITKNTVCDYKLYINIAPRKLRPIFDEPHVYQTSIVSLDSDKIIKLVNPVQLSLTLRRSIQELVLDGAISISYLKEHIFKSHPHQWVFKSATLKNIYNHWLAEQVPCDNLQIICVDETYAWVRIFSWASYFTSSTYTPQRLSIKCKIDFFSVYRQSGPLLNDLIKENDSMIIPSPLETLELQSRESFGPASHDMLQEWIKQLTLIIQSRKFEKLKRLTLDVHFNYKQSPLRDIKMNYQSIVDGVALKVITSFNLE